MKKTLFIIFVLALCLCLGIVCFAEKEEGQNGSSGTSTPTTGNAESDDRIDVKAYIMDKMVPVAVAVLTSIVAFLATLGTIAKSLKSLKETKDAFKDEAKERAVFFDSGVIAIKDTMLDL